MKPIFKKIREFLPSLIYIIALIVFVEVWGFKGAIFYFAFFFFWGGYKLYRSRNIFMANLRNIEAMFFGKPLDKDNWNKGELKKVKTKIVWGRKNESKRKRNTKPVK